MSDHDNEPRAQRHIGEHDVQGMVSTHDSIKGTEFTAGRKHEVFMLAEQIVDLVKKAGLRGRERCFLKTMCELLLES